MSGCIVVSATSCDLPVWSPSDDPTTPNTLTDAEPCALVKSVNFPCNYTDGITDIYYYTGTQDDFVIKLVDSFEVK